MSIKAEHLTYKYGDGTAFEQYALKDVNFEIPDGQFVGLIGHTGSGKSTLIQHLNGLIKPTSRPDSIQWNRYSQRRLQPEEAEKQSRTGIPVPRASVI